uniref:Uncharacterized protein n=1 Tax=Tanacetum cinerariifolium TaxID=118510 RepID=A0A699IXN3_TANCI|nr:hypothetical protein [Tanacetum cinerariifolium]
MGGKSPIQEHREGNALDTWISALKQGEQRLRGSTSKDIYLLPLQRCQPSSERPRSRLFELTKEGERKQRARAYGGEDKATKAR